MVYSYIVAAIAVLTSVGFLLRRQASNRHHAMSKVHPLTSVPLDQLPEYIQSLVAEIPESIILQSDVEAFQKAVDHSWAQQNREIIPACIVRPRSTQQLSKAVEVLKREYETRIQAGISTAGFVSVRSGGASPGLGVATLQDGIMIDLSLICEVTPAIDGSTVTVGVGAKWLDVYKALDEKGLIAVGGRSAPVGVGGLALQGKVSEDARAPYKQVMTTNNAESKEVYPSTLQDLASYAPTS
jgi:hypothetical protein